MTTATENDDRLLIPRLDACRILSIGETSFWKLDKDHEIEVVHQGRRAYVTAESLHAYVERLRASAAETADVEEVESPDIVQVAAQQRVRGASPSPKAPTQKRD
jgi:hypothetical protein